jgi:hypothetical protein
MALLPTTHLYFLNSCAGSVSSFFRRGPIRSLGDNCFAAGETVLLVRQDRPNLMDRLRAFPPGRLVYLIDDDIQAASEDASLPEDYRSRLIRFHEEYHADLVARADTLVVTSDTLLRKFSSHRDVRIVHPVWHLEAADDRHFDAMSHGGPIHAMHLGTASHQAGLDFLQPVVEVLLERFARFHFSYVGRSSRLGVLDAHPRVHREKPQSWSRYRRTLARRRIHLGLYPLPDTPFNRARSRNKVLEHAIVGAVGVYSRSWPTAGESPGCAILAGEDAADWIAALSPYLEAPQRLRHIAQIARQSFAALNDPTAQRQFWAEVLGARLPLPIA